MQPDPSTPTLHDVAKLAGVSTATVSRCLNTPRQVSEKTREKVNAAVEKLGYSPNFGARVMASNRTKTIAAIIPTMENAVFAAGLQAFQEELSVQGFTLLLASSNYDPDVEQSQIRTMVARGADAILLIGYERDARIYQFLKQQNIPHLIAWAHDPVRLLPCVGFSNREAMFAMANRIIDLGHKRLAMITAPTAQNDRAAERLAGLRDAMMAKGLSPSLLDVVETPYGIDAGAEALREILDKTPRPTAVLCGNDVLAAGALRQAQKMRLDVPDDLSIVGFDDIELARLTQPALTTVRVPHVEMGRAAARALVAMVKDPTLLTSELLKTHIAMRDSLAPPP